MQGHTVYARPYTPSAATGGSGGQELPPVAALGGIRHSSSVPS